jgi:hypothetical protein
MRSSRLRSVLVLTCVLGMYGSSCVARAEVPMRATHAERQGHDQVEHLSGDGELSVDPSRTGVNLGPSHVPQIGEVLAAAYAAAGLDRDPSRWWVRRARLSGLVPWVSVRTGRNTRWQDTGSDVDYGVALEVRATWRLDRLVFEGRELQVASVEAARRRERRQLARDVIRLYFGWQRAIAEDDPIEAGAGAAELDALTDGWFSEALAGRRARRRGGRR